VYDGDHFGRILLSNFAGHLDTDGTTAHDDDVGRLVNLIKKFENKISKKYIDYQSISNLILGHQYFLNLKS
jgi:hypothetical protein